MSEKPQEAWKSEVAKLEKIAGTKPIELGIKNIESKDSLFEAKMAFDSSKGDKGLTYLAKRLYKEYKKLPDADALKAAVSLASLFLKKVQKSDIKLEDGDTLRVMGNKALLFKRNEIVEVDLGEKSLREIEAKKEEVKQESIRKREEIRQQVAETGETLLAKRPLKKLLREHFGEEFLGRLKDVSYPEYAMEAYEFTFNRQKYYLAAVLALRQKEFTPKIPLKKPIFRLTKGSMVDKTEVEWTEHFDMIMDKIK